MNLTYFDNYIIKIIIIQKNIRKFLDNKNNIYLQHKQNIIYKKFIDELTGFHIINNEPIKEHIWEKINENIVKNIFTVNYYSNGSHISGIDNKFNNWRISNKTGCIGKNSNIMISSYRLSSICNAKNISTSKNIVKEITERNKNFDYYSLLLRNKEIKNNEIIYYWYIIPKDLYIFNIIEEDLVIHHRNKDSTKDIIGYKSKNCSISFSMSSQLWYNFKQNDIKKYLVKKINIPIKQYNISYSYIYEIVKNNPSLFISNNI